jgi:monoamine oxidase
MGLLAEPPADSTPFQIPPNAGRGTKVAILGAGIAGLVAAYEMRRAGFDCTVLEARERPGGRLWTIRRGDRVEFTDGTVQHCNFDHGLYLNAGAGRIPSIHRTILGYCRELNVALEVEVNTSRSSLLESDRAFDGRPIEQRQALHDARGHVAELLARAIQKGALDQEVTADDRERMLAFLRNFGDLNAAYIYAGSSRAGLAQYPGAGETGAERREPLPMRALLDADFWRALTFEEGLDMQATMLQPVGGMDRIPYAFAKSLGSVVKYRSPVREIRKTSNGVRIVYADPRGGPRSLEAAYCICTLPVPVLAATQHDFPARIVEAMKQVSYAAAYKIAWESKRFWERENNIYGGISWLSNGPISLEAGALLGNVWYPSDGFLSEKGVLISGYATETGEFAALPSMDAKFAASRAAVEKLHPGRGKELSKPLYIAWARIPFSLGSWVRAGTEYYEGPYKEFLVPDGRIYFAGDYCSHLTTWQEGAVLSAQRAAGMIVERMRQTA